jgi:hypothetical protein
MKLTQRAMMVGLAALVLPAGAEAQGPPQKMFDPGTAWQRAVGSDGNCVWSGREPDGATIYAWETGCNGSPNVWGYALTNPNQLDAVVWLANIPACGGTVARAWQWFDNGNWSEYVGIRNPSSCALDYYSSRATAGCPATITGLSQRNVQMYKNALPIMAGSDRLAQEKAWHAYNRTSLTFSVCQRQLAAAGPQDYHNSY